MLDLQMQGYNSRKGYLKGEWCSICKKKGYVAEKVVIRGHEYLVMKECSCLSARKLLYGENE